ncbi:MAG: RNA polymerase sigma-70 factor [Phaeodactylibacter sp.]|nr:RNA polymerase sigma-70 factor [Phaeodactylibacter sp.]
MREEVKHQHLKALVQGNEQSFRWLYDYYHQKIYHYSLRIVRLKPLAEEATADVFVIIWKKRRQLDPLMPFEPLLYKIAKDMAYNYLKKIAVDNRLKENFLNQSNDLKNNKSGEIIFLEKEALLAIHEIVENLPQKRKEIFKLRYYEGLNNQFIAQKLNISVNTVREQLARARQFLKKHSS